MTTSAVFVDDAIRRAYVEDMSRQEVLQRFEAECPVAFEVYRQAEEDMRRVSEAVTRALAAIDPVECMHYSKIVEEEFGATTQRWLLARKVLQRFIERHP